MPTSVNHKQGHSPSSLYPHVRVTHVLRNCLPCDSNMRDSHRATGGCTCADSQAFYLNSAVMPGLDLARPQGAGGDKSISQHTGPECWQERPSWSGDSWTPKLWSLSSSWSWSPRTSTNDTITEGSFLAGCLIRPPPFVSLLQFQPFSLVEGSPFARSSDFLFSSQ